MVVFGCDDARDSQGGYDRIEEGRLDLDRQVCVDSFGGRCASAGVDGNNFP